MAPVAELDLSFFPRAGEAFELDLRYTPASSGGEIWLPREGTLLRIDMNAARACQDDPLAHGRLLGDVLLRDPKLREAFAAARADAEAANCEMRVRLHFAPGGTLGSLRWETMRDPFSESWVFARQGVSFSRYLVGNDWRPTRTRPRRELKSAAMIANPAELARYGLDPLDGAAELERARAALGPFQPSLIAPGQASRERLRELLRSGVDLLLLVCHGSLVKGESWLWLEDGAGGIARISGSELAREFDVVSEPPRLVVLISCFGGASEGNERQNGDDAAMALGPRLAQAGIPAVLAMQGPVSVETISQFLPQFFQALDESGCVDTACAHARLAVAHRPDWWMPVLFSRLRTCRLWYTPGFTKDGGLDKWPALARHIARGRCTPVLGPALTEPLLGSRLDLAQEMAASHGAGILAQSERGTGELLTYVSQFLALDQDEFYPAERYLKVCRQSLDRRHGALLPPEMARESLSKRLSAVGSILRRDSEFQPYRVLAQLATPIYIVAEHSELLEDALREAGKKPHIERCRWQNDDCGDSIFDRMPDYRPDTANPLVYRLFGTLSDPESLVLSEDRFFDFLIGVTANREAIPGIVRRALADSALMFLGFHVEDWDFRALFRGLLDKNTAERRRRYAHVAAQIDPESSANRSTEATRRYLERYLASESVSVFWGDVESFAIELVGRLRQEAQP